jgi:hypothetical protein
MRSHRMLAAVTITLMLTLLAISGGVLAKSSNYRAHLAGREEVPAVNTRSQGQALFKVADDGASIDFKLIVANITDITQAHIHCGSAGVNGPVVAFLYGFGPTVSTNGVLSEGTLTASSVIPRPDSVACPGGVANLDDLIAQIAAGNAYVNVHTVQNPPGEIRGQIR